MSGGGNWSRGNWTGNHWDANNWRGPNEEAPAGSIYGTTSITFALSGTLENGAATGDISGSASITFEASGTLGYTGTAVSTDAIQYAGNAGREPVVDWQDMRRRRLLAQARREDEEFATMIAALADTGILDEAA